MKRDPGEGEVVRLPAEAPAVAPPARGRQPAGLHGLAILGMAACAVVGIAATLAFITVTWPGGAGRYVVAVILACALGFVACAAIAVLFAARDTYARGDAGGRETRD